MQICLHGEEIKFGEKQPSDLRQSCAQPSINYIHMYHIQMLTKKKKKKLTQKKCGPKYFFFALNQKSIDIFLFFSMRTYKCWYSVEVLIEAHLAVALLISTHRIFSF